MLLHLTDFSDEPLQSQIVRQIRAKVLSSELSAGANLPSIRKLARDLHISVITVQRAYEGLEREGLIHSKRSKGFFVVDLKEGKKKKMSEERLKANIKPQILMAAAEGLETKDIKKIVDSILVELKKEKKQGG